MPDNSLDNFRVQEIGLKIEKVILRIEKLKKTEDAFLKKRNKHLKEKKISKIQLKEFGSELEKWILLVKNLKQEKNKIKVENCIRVFDNYLKIKSKRIEVSIALESLKRKLDKVYKKIGRREWYKTYIEQKEYSVVSREDRKDQTLIRYEDAITKREEFYSKLNKTRTEWEKFLAEYEKAKTETKKAYAEKEEIIAEWEESYIERKEVSTEKEEAIAKWNKAVDEEKKTRAKTIKARAKNKGVCVMTELALNQEERTGSDYKKAYNDWKENYDKEARLIIKKRKMEQDRGKMRNYLKKNKKELDKILNILEKFFTGVVPKNKLEEKESSLICPDCGIEIRQNHLSESFQKLFCLYCGSETSIIKINGLWEIKK